MHAPESIGLGNTSSGTDTPFRLLDSDSVEELWYRAHSDKERMDSSLAASAELSHYTESGTTDGQSKSGWLG